MTTRKWFDDIMMQVHAHATEAAQTAVITAVYDNGCSSPDTVELIMYAPASLANITAATTCLLVWYASLHCQCYQDSCLFYWFSGHTITQFLAFPLPFFKSFLTRYLAYPWPLICPHYGLCHYAIFMQFLYTYWWHIGFWTPSIFKPFCHIHFYILHV